MALAADVLFGICRFFTFYRLRWLLLGGRVRQALQGAARDGPQVQAGHAAIGTVTFAVLFKELSIHFPVAVQHTHPALDCQIIIA